MIIDLHTRIWHGVDQLGPDAARRLRTAPTVRWGQLEAGPTAHDRAMHCVDAAVVIGFRSELLGAHVPNEYVADYVGRDPKRRIGVAGIDPMGDDPVGQVEAGLDLGLAGVALSPAEQGFHPAHSAAMPVYERCVEAGIPIFVTLDPPVTSAARLDFARPALWDEVARSFPTLPIVIGGLGHPWIDETLLLVAKHERVWSDLSGVVSRPWQLYGALVDASALGVLDKLLFGSGFPFELPAKAIESLYSVNAYGQGTPLPTVPRALLRGIVERDAIAALGLNAVIAERPDATVPTAERHEPAAVVATVGPMDDDDDEPAA